MTPFIGYPELDDLLRAVPNEVFGMCIAEQGEAGTHGLSIQTHRIIVQGYDGAVVRYWQFTVGKVQVMAGGQELSPEHAERTRVRAKAAWELIGAHIENFGTGRVIEVALIATPRDYKYLDGSQPKWMRYDKESDCFVLAQKEAA